MARLLGAVMASALLLLIGWVGAAAAWDRGHVDTFAVLPDFDGTGFSVGGIMPGATSNFDGPQDVRHWLMRLSGLHREEAPLTPRT